ncbi:MAG: PH domain-containing protein [Candidatus Acidiferrales bacterium]
MSYITKSLVPGETLLFETRHHWIVLLGPLFLSLLLGIPGVALLLDAVAAKNGHGDIPSLESSLGPGGMTIFGTVLVLIAVIIFAWGLAKRNATEMAVTNRRVLIKTGMASRRTLDLMLNKVESIGVTETFLGRIFGYGSVLIHGTGGTPESFVMIAHPQQFRQSVQEQIGGRQPA